MIEPDPRPDDGGAHCPVCAWPRSGLQVPCCDRLHGEETARTWSLQGHNDFCAAVRTAALVPGPRGAACFARLLARCRDVGKLSDGALAAEVERAQHAVQCWDRRDRVSRRPEGVVAMSLARMVAGELHRLVLLELGPDGLYCYEIVGKSDGSLHPSACGARQDIWAEFVGGGPGSERRNFFLAGGVADDEPPPRRDRGQLRQLAENYLVQRAIRATDPDSEYLLVRRVTGWLVIDLLAGALRSCVLPTGELVLRPSAPPLGQLVDDWCATAPLRHGYELAVAAIDQDDGVVSVSTVALFGAGTAGEPGGAVRVPVELARPDGQAGPVTLPVLIANGGPVRDRAQLLVGQAQLPGPGPVSCELVLRRPGYVEFGPLRPVPTGLAVAVTVSNRPSWSDIVRSLPSHHAFEVVVAVELSGTPEVVDPRVEILRNLVHALHIRDTAAPGSVRVAAIRYVDHPEKAPRRYQPTCHVEPFAAPHAMIDSLTRWHPSPPQGRYGSSVEDALHQARQLPWRREALRCMVVIGSRPPSVNRIGSSRGSVCPHGYVWRDELAALRDGLAVRCFAVVDEPPWMTEPIYDAPVDRTRHDWRALGADGLFKLGELKLPDLVERLIPGPSAPLPLAVLTRRDRDDA